MSFRILGHKQNIPVCLNSLHKTQQIAVSFFFIKNVTFKECKLCQILYKYNNSVVIWQTWCPIFFQGIQGVIKMGDFKFLRFEQSRWMLWTRPHTEKYLIHLLEPGTLSHKKLCKHLVREDKKRERRRAKDREPSSSPGSRTRWTPISSLSPSTLVPRASSS